MWGQKNANLIFWLYPYEVPGFSWPLRTFIILFIWYNFCQVNIITRNQKIKILLLCSTTFFLKQPPEVFYKESLKISQNRQESTCARVTFSKKVAGLSPATLLRKRFCRRCFPMNSAKCLRSPFFTEHVRENAFVSPVNWIFS